MANACIVTVTIWLTYARTMLPTSSEVCSSKFRDDIDVYLASYAMYCYAVAAGMIAGEGLGGIVNAVLQIAGVSGAVHGTSVGCPMGAYCG